MRITIDINQHLLKKAMFLTGITSKKEVVEYGLKELIRIASCRDSFETTKRPKGKTWDEYEKELIDKGKISEESLRRVQLTKKREDA